RIASAPDRQWELALRIPDWAERPSLTVNGEELGSSPADGWWTVQREWHEGDEVVLALPLQPRYTTADPRVDAARGAVALEYGPLVYCLEAVDNPGPRLDDITIDTATTPEVVPGEGLLAGVATIRTTGQVRARPNSSWWPYRPTGALTAESREPTALNAIPYYTWGNREQGAMRVWVPTNHIT
ncbi:MAG TPA: glycoside hydrolase family 127 protein, partial [Propionibacteriaceae bacterium]|nr:glycoside hydrolase family 127 protein [Propionibacteriaceae bacterium]